MQKISIIINSIFLIVTMSFCSLNAQAISEKTPFFNLEPLGYEFDALEPYIDAETMKIHYSKHHKAYVDKLNAALENHKLKGQSLEMIFKSVKENDEDQAVLNNAGGHFNHTMFWKILTPGGGKRPTGKLYDAINKKYGSFDNFTKEFSNTAAGVFGSGWAWLSIDAKGELFISKTKNQDNPYMLKVVKKTGTPVLCLDVWEHAYYLKYQNKRTDYIANFMKALNWDVVSENYNQALVKK